ncbi:GntR family transcriptional regulator [Bradyrhizobium canariense]|uniref:Transcriptional regulator, GntR family n=1 Tax=Bradyrhizobium canariense TaxID=255045 RepID=A0A1H1XPB7_9BRAD|nr:GntR family transcriptional regulator [Bradyrhizobium canariense]SDT10679.1 transcriptional regulator, GntR family [Bradyrhizobium canariense]
MSELNQAAYVYREIKRRIVELEYRLGERLSETRLASELGVGRSPLRSALARLKGEGWLAISPQSGTFVKALTNRDIQEVTELRTVLEMHATRIAAVRITSKELDALKMAFDTLGPRITSGRSEPFIDLDNQLHQAIYTAADNQLVHDILNNLRDKVQWIRRACSVSLDRVQDGFHEIESIFEALEKRDGEAAAERMRTHIQNAAAFCRAIDPEARATQPKNPLDVAV